MKSSVQDLGQTSERRLLQSRAVASILLVVSLNLILSFLYRTSIKEKLEVFPKSEAWFALNGYLDNPDANLLLFGSSLMKRVICCGDAVYLNEKVKANRHRECVHLERRLENLAQRPVNSCSLSMGGCFPSDAYLLASLVEPSQRTKLVIYGITPRDFSNTHLKTAASTPPFRLVSFLKPLSAMDRCLFNDEKETMDFRVQNSLVAVAPMYAWRTVLTRSFLASSRTLLDRLFPMPKSSAAGKRSHRRAAMHALTIVDPATEVATPFSDTSRSFKKTYNPFRPQMFNTQIHFLDAFVRRYTSRGIHVVLVNMPMAEGKVRALSETDYRRYFMAAKKVASSYDSTFIDMNTKEFEQSDFRDCVHLNGKGAMKFVELFSARLAVSHALKAFEESR